MKKSIHYGTYPESVSEITGKILEGLNEAEFFTTEEADYDITFKRFADFFLGKWVKGDALEEISEQEFNDLLHSSVIESDLERLKSKNLLDCIEDENGKMLYFVTEEGKKAVEGFRAAFE